MISRINFQTWVGNCNEIDKIERKHLKENDKFLCDSTIFIYKNGKWKLHNKQIKDYFHSEFFNEDFQIESNTIKLLLNSINDNCDMIINIPNKNIMLNSFECKILLNEILEM